MVFTSEHERFIIEFYSRNGVFNNGEWTYSTVKKKSASIDILKRLFKH
jgi:hypothetical protein